MNLKQALERIEALERRVRELEARPEQHVHYHTHPVAPSYAQPYYAPQPLYPPLLPQVPWVVTCGAGVIGGGFSN